MAQRVILGGEQVEVVPKTVRFRKGDWEALDAAYPAKGARDAIRVIIAAHVDRIRSKAASAMSIDVQEFHTPIKSTEGEKE